MNTFSPCLSLALLSKFESLLHFGMIIWLARSPLVCLNDLPNLTWMIILTIALRHLYRATWRRKWCTIWYLFGSMYPSRAENLYPYTLVVLSRRNFSPLRRWFNIRPILMMLLARFHRLLAAWRFRLLITSSVLASSWDTLESSIHP